MRQEPLTIMTGPTTSIGPLAVRKLSTVRIFMTGLTVVLTPSRMPVRKVRTPVLMAARAAYVCMRRVQEKTRMRVLPRRDLQVALTKTRVTRLVTGDA